MQYWGQARDCQELQAATATSSETRAEECTALWWGDLASPPLPAPAWLWKLNWALFPAPSGTCDTTQEHCILLQAPPHTRSAEGLWQVQQRATKVAGGRSYQIKGEAEATGMVSPAEAKVKASAT